MQQGIGIDVGGTKIAAVALELDGVVRIVGESVVPTPDDPSRFIEAVIDVAQRLVPLLDGPPEGIGVGLAGYLGLDGILAAAPNLGVAIGLDVATPLRSALGVRVVVDNDANCAAWASARIDAPDATQVVAVTLGTGIGGGIVIDGKLVRGALGFAGEPGHMIIVRDGQLCACGQHGCWEAYASGSALSRMAIDAGFADGKALGAAAARGELAAGIVLDEYAAWIALGLMNIVNLTDPAVIVIGGGVVGLGDTLLDRVRAAALEYPTFATGRFVEIRPATSGPDAGAIGAALLAIQ